MKKSLRIYLSLSLLLVLVPALVTGYVNLSNRSIQRQLLDTPPTLSSELSSDLPLESQQKKSTDFEGGFGSGVSHLPPEAIVQESVKNDLVVDRQGREYPIRRYTTAALPNDPYASQWWVEGTGLDAAWDVGEGATQTLVAVIDTGFSLNHEEFIGRWYQNDGEVGIATAENPSDLNCSDRSLPLDASCNNIDDDFDGISDNETGTVVDENPSRLNCTDQSLTLDKSCNLVDDDGNGFIDDVTGWDFANYDQIVEAGETDPSGSSTDHGTMVAGVAAANANNGVGIAGVNWTTKLLPIQVFNDSGYADTVTVSRAIRYAAEQGADVINLSLSTLLYDSYLREAVRDALEAGSLVVAASGNDGCNCISYPANFPEALAVGATDTDGTVASYSSYGTNLDIVAPGSSIRTPVWNGSSSSTYAVGVDGTSFASPYVSGLLALARSHHPTASWAQLISAVTETTDKSSLGSNADHSSVYGFGSIDAQSALDRLTTPTTIEMAYSFGSLTGNDVLSDGTVYQCPSSGRSGVQVYRLSSGTSNRYTTSGLVRDSFESLGYSSEVSIYGCMTLPGDTVNAVRLIDIGSEFYNRPSKYSH